jgi:hypothetical protein
MARRRKVKLTPGEAESDPLVEVAVEMGDAFYEAVMPMLSQLTDHFKDDEEMQALFYAWDPSRRTMDWEMYNEYWLRKWETEDAAEEEAEAPWKASVPRFEA